MKRNNKKGFTVVELVIVIAVIAILAAVLIPTFAGLIQKANESNDIQAAKNMNTFLAAANVTDGVDSILDVYDIFEDSGYSVESYKPLYAGRSYYYDKQANQIVYVDDATGKILFPTDRKDQLQGDHDWMSLSLTLPKTEKLEGDNYKKEVNKTTAIVSKPEQYAWVVDEYNNGKITGDLVIQLTETLDFKGAMCVIRQAKGNITIESATEGTQVTIKNITSNIQIFTDDIRNAQNIPSAYYASGIVAVCDGDKSITIKDVIFENINVKSPAAGQVGVVIGCLNRSSAVFDNVTLKNCSVIGHRDVGALVGGMQSGTSVLTLKNTIALDNVKVKTVGGRSGLVVGKVSYNPAQHNNSKIEFVNNATININNSALSIYEDTAFKQEFATPGAVPATWTENNDYTWNDMDKMIRSLKATDGSEGYSVYGFKSDSLVGIEKAGNKTWSAITSVDALKAYNWSN